MTNQYVKTNLWRSVPETGFLLDMNSENAHQGDNPGFLEGLSRLLSRTFYLERVLQWSLEEGKVRRRVLRRGYKKGLSRRHLEGRTTPFQEYDPVRVLRPRKQSSMYVISPGWSVHLACHCFAANSSGSIQRFRVWSIWSRSSERL